VTSAECKEPEPRLPTLFYGLLSLVEGAYYWWRMRCVGLLTLVCGVAAALAGSVKDNATPIRNSQQILADGLAIWRKPGAIQNHAACATCHSPDGIEIAAYKFDDADIIRRAQPHVGSAGARLLAEYFHTLRDRLHLYPLRDPDQDRPLQPGGKVLAGDTPGARDQAFGLELKLKLPLLFGPRIKSIAQAKAAESELLFIDPVNLKIGILLNRLSEDIAHGNEHASIAQWLPEDPPSISPSDQTTWYAAEDRYLMEPTQQRLHALLLLNRRLIDTSTKLGLGVLSAAKFRALLVWQDRIRNRTESAPLSVAGDVSLFGAGNAIWDVGQRALDVIGQNPTSLGMDEETRAKKLSGASFPEQLHQLRLAWFWAGWLSDQGLYKSSHDDKVRLGMWLSQSLSQDGPYPIHSVFANARRQAVVSNDPEAWGDAPVQRRRIWDFAGLRAFSYLTRDLPREVEHRKLTIAFTANCLRMNLLLLKDDIRRTNAVWVRQSSLANAKELVSFLTKYDPEGSEDARQLGKELAVLINKAKERNQFAPQMPQP